MRLIRLLTNLAIGYPEWHVPLGFDPAQRFAEIEALGGPDEIERIRDAEPEEEEDFEPGRDALWQRDAYEAVIGRIVTLQGLSRDEDPDVRAAAVKALAWFPGAAPESVRFVREALVRETGPKERANALLSLGILARYLNDRSDVPALLACLSPDEAPSVRLSAAISLAVILGKSAPAECIDVLLDAVQSPELRTWSGGIGSAPSPTRARRSRPRSQSRPSRSSPRCVGLRAGEQPWRGAEVNNTLLGLVFPDPSTLGSDPRTGFRRVTPEELTPEQRRAIYAIGRRRSGRPNPTTTAGSWTSGWSTACRGSRISIGRCLRRFGGQNPRGPRNDPA